MFQVKVFNKLLQTTFKNNQKKFLDLEKALKILEGTVAQVPPQGGRKHPQQEYLQIDTTNILFIVGGAFDGLDEIINRRLGENSVGFNTNLKNNDKLNSYEIFQNVEPRDLIKYGLIPEFIGRLRVVTSVDELDQDALIEILTEPKNAIIKQFQKIFALDDIELKFTDDSLVVMSELALKRKTGARGLRSILEKLLLDEMYESPSRKDIEQIIIDKENVTDDIQPKMVLREKKESTVFLLSFKVKCFSIIEAPKATEAIATE